LGILEERFTCPTAEDLSFKMPNCWIFFLYKGKVLLDAMVNVPFQKCIANPSPFVRVLS